MTVEGNLVVRQSRIKMLLLLLGSVMFVAGSIWILLSDIDSVKATIAAWAGLPFFGLCAVMIGMRVFDNSPQLAANREGLQYARWSGQTILWSDVDDIFLFSVQRQKMVGLVLADPAKYPGKGILAKLASANKAISGADISIPAAGLDMPATDIYAALMRLSGRSN